MLRQGLRRGVNKMISSVNFTGGVVGSDFDSTERKLRMKPRVTNA